MKGKIKLYIAVIGLVGICCLVLYQGIGTKQEESYEYSDDYVQVKELPAMLDFYYFTKEEWEEKIKEEDFGAIVTPEAVAWILKQTGSEKYITYDAKAKKRISREEWNQIYEQLLDLLDEEHTVQIADEVILKTDAETIYGSSKTYQCKLDQMKIEPMTTMGFYVKEDVIIGIRSMKSKSVTLSNVYVKEAGGGKLEFLSKGESYTIELEIQEPEKTGGHVCDLLWEDGSLVKVQVKEDTIQGNLIAVDDATIEIEGYGQLKRSQNLPVYKTYGSIEEKDLSNIVIANMKVEYVVAKDQVEAILLVEPAQMSRIRALLLAEDGSSYRSEVFLGANCAYQAVKREETQDLPPEAVLKASEWFANEGENSIRVQPLEEDGLLFLCDEKGAKISNGYQGVLELRRYPEGFAVVSELPIEQYLCAVVPSEMPVTYAPEALKAQAVCARSYAYIQLQNGDYAAFGAHVDDTTNYQVYNKQERNDVTTAAVLDTAGTVLKYNGEIAEAYYFSTSAGVTGNGDAWNLTADPKFGYLNGTLMKEGGGSMDLSSEEAFRKFIAEPDAAAYEKEYPFFRWTAVGDYTQPVVWERIAEILNARKNRTPKDIVYSDKQGNPVETLQDFGALLQIRVTKRGISGVALQLQLEYEQGIVTVGNEYNIRALLGAGITELTLLDGSKRKSALLPSAYAVVVPLENGAYQISGGGYGHGIGMSQNGAQAMALSGKNYEEILKFSFQNIELGNGDAT